MIKLIAVDLDDTLLNRKKQISDRTAKTIQKAISHNIKIIPCTGRQIKGIPQQVFDILKPQYTISLNGTSITDMRTGEKIFRADLTDEEALSVIEAADKYHAILDVFVDDYSYMNQMTYDRLIRVFSGTALESYIRKMKKVVPDIKEFSRTHTTQEIALIPKNHESFCGILDFVKTMPTLQCFALPDYVEIVSQNASKETGVLRIADIFGIKPEEIMTFGDSMNDIPMLKSPGVTGVAMKNADEKAKSYAKYITDDCDRDGVARAIEKYVLPDYE